MNMRANWSIFFQTWSGDEDPERTDISGTPGATRTHETRFRNTRLAFSPRFEAKLYDLGLDDQQFFHHRGVKSKEL